MAQNIIAIVQARMGSTRLPGKVMQQIAGKPLIEVLLHRLSRSTRLNKIIIATSINKKDDTLVNFVNGLGYDVFRGSEEDVLDRYYCAAQKNKAEIVVRVTGDCPLIDAVLVDNIIQQFLVLDVDYISNIAPATFPDGLDTEVFSHKALTLAWEQAVLKAEREHVTPFLRQGRQFKRANYKNNRNLSGERWTVDEPEDLEVIRRIFEQFSPKLDFSWEDVMPLTISNPEIFSLNKSFERNEGARMGTGQKLWKRAKRIIPGGNMLLSKRAEMFLPDYWPAYFSKAKGCRVWDLDGKQYIDMSIMGIGTNILGYGHPEVDEAVREVVKNGNMSTFNCPEEVTLAERLVELHPWADMVRFARTGGEANAIAIRIARAASGKDKVAICGYHGWHDWYLAANLGDEENLDGHLLPGLEPKGVPRKLIGTSLPFEYNDFDALLKLHAKHDIGTIKMEVSRNVGPAKGFLEKVRDFATKNDIILIFDECTSGFRQTNGGLHKHFGVEPDMAIFGKAIGNGYALTASIGRREIMEAAQSTFISSTFWTERIGPSAALKTLEVMERTKSWEQISTTGKNIGERWHQLASRHNLVLKTSGLSALINFTILSADWLKYKTLITQEMLKKSYLAAHSVYVCTEHTPAIINQYFEYLEPIFELISQCESGQKSIDELLEGPVCHSGFKRLN